MDMAEYTRLRELDKRRRVEEAHRRTGLSIELLTMLQEQDERDWEELLLHGDGSRPFIGIMKS